MKSSDIVAQLAVALPQFTGDFTTNYVVSSLTRSGTTVTATTTVDHGMVPGMQANVTGAKTPIAVSSLTRSGTVGTLVTSADHDLTESESTQAEVAGATEAEFNGAFTILSIPNRRTVKFTMADAGPTTATGSPLLLNGSSVLQQYNGLHAITAVPASNQFQYEITDSTIYTPAAGTIYARMAPRISAAISLDRIIDAYTKQTQDDLWAFVVLGDVLASKSRSIESDAVDNQQRGDYFRQQLIQPFAIYVVFPTSQEIASRQARDKAEEIFRPLCQSILFKAFDSQLYAGAQGPVHFVSHGFAYYNSAIYVHEFTFEQVADLTFNDTVGYDLDVAFRDIAVNMGVSTGTEIITAQIDLDDEPLP